MQVLFWFQGRRIGTFLATSKKYATRQIRAALWCSDSKLERLRCSQRQRAKPPDPGTYFLPGGAVAHVEWPHPARALTHPSLGRVLSGCIPRGVHGFGSICRSFKRVSCKYEATFSRKGVSKQAHAPSRFIPNPGPTAPSSLSLEPQPSESTPR